MLTSKQKEFCKQIADGKNATEAYQIAFGAKSMGTCKVNGSKLLKQPAIAEKIQELKSVAKKIAERSQGKAIDTVEEGSIMDKIERMRVLTQIGRGEIPLQKPMVCDGIIELVDVVPDWMDRKNAIAELNKMCGDYAATKIEATVSGIKSLHIERASTDKHK